MILRIPNEIGSSLACLIYVIKNKDIVNYLNGLIEQGYLTKKFELTKKGNDIFKTLKVEDTTFLNVQDLAKEYRDCFKDESGKALKPGATGSLTLIAKRLLDFKQLYPQFTDEQIIKAVKNYISSEAKSGFQYLQKSHYTISKKEGDYYESKLLTFCEELEDDIDDDLKFDLDV